MSESKRIWELEGDAGSAANYIAELEGIICYALDIDKRCHGDDYAYDDCWLKMRTILEDSKVKKCDKCETMHSSNIDCQALLEDK